MRLSCWFGAAEAESHACSFAELLESMMLFTEVGPPECLLALMLPYVTVHRFISRQRRWPLVPDTARLRLVPDNTGNAKV